MTRRCRGRTMSFAPQFREGGSAMTFDQSDRTVVTSEPAPAAGQQTVQTEHRRITKTSPGGPEMARRVIVLVFGPPARVVGLRIRLLPPDAREATRLVSGILSVSQ